MDSRALLQNIKDLTSKTRNESGLANSQLFDSLILNLSVDTSLTTPFQSYWLLEDLTSYLERIQESINTYSISPEEQAKAQLAFHYLQASIKEAVFDFAIATSLVAPNANRPPERIELGALIGITQGWINEKNPTMLQDPENQKFKKMSNFGIKGQVGEEGGAFSHSTLKASKLQQDGEVLRDKHNGVWYAKVCENKTIAAREVVIQEFCRLLMPYQSKTRLGRHNDLVYVLSKESPGSESLDAESDNEYYQKNKETRAKLESGEYKGMGDSMLANIWLNERDAKLGNRRVDTEGRVLAIDGDWALASLRHDDPGFYGAHDITPHDIDNLPFIQDYRPFNWFDTIHGGVKATNYATRPELTLFGLDFNEHAGFRGEINQTMLQVLMMPKDFIQAFIKSYISDPVEINMLTDVIMDRTLQLRNAALVNASFQEYIQTPAAIKHVEKTIAAMQEFKTMGKNKIIDTIPSAAESFKQEFLNLKQEIVSKLVPKIAVVGAAPAPPVPVENKAPVIKSAKNFSLTALINMQKKKKNPKIVLPANVAPALEQKAKKLPPPLPTQVVTTPPVAIPEKKSAVRKNKFFSKSKSRKQISPIAENSAEEKESPKQR
jgi:hypothetical protein